ncbi:hypothetical protein TWF718_000725 [Orbilia javanica]|uniref:HMG box domain-containing protein n=1 Tax=Orbilia javanica TaxID=47235 RepID=A0AAN8NCR4_9PEZI
MLAVGRSRLAASSGLSLPKLSALVARAIARSGPLSSGAANALNSQATFAPFVKANLPILTNLVLREFATAAKKPATKKKAPAKKAPAKRSTTTTTKKPAAKRRTVAKKAGTRRTVIKKKPAAKKKAAPKKKVIKKATPKKPGIQTQYDKALGDAPSKKASPYNLFFVETLKSLDSSTRAPEKAKLVAEKWRGLSDAEKKTWQDRAAEETVKRKAAYDQWLSKLNPLEIEAANLARQRIRGYREKKGIKGTSPATKIKDDRLVKRPCTPWVFFMKEKYSSGVVDNVEHKQKMSKLAEMWKGTTEAERKKYNDLASKDTARYKAERAAFLKKYGN